jgi:hypothetical protein
MSLAVLGLLAGCSTVVDAIEEGGGIGSSAPIVDKSGSGMWSRFDHEEISPEDVTLYEYDPGADNLPEGLYYGNDGQIVFEKEYPTPKTEVQKAGELDARSHEDYSPDEIRRGMRQAAAEMRANIAVVNVEEGTGTAVFMPDAEPAPVERDPQVLLDRQAKEAADRGFTKKVDTRRISLDSPEPLKIDTRGGDCHAIVLALDKEAEFNLAAKQNLRTEFSHPDPYIAEKLANNPSFESSSAGTRVVRSRRARAAWTSVGCVNQAGELAIRFLPDADYVDGEIGEADNPALGTGEMIVEIYQETGKTAEDVEQERQKAKERAEERQEEYIREVCNECVQDHYCARRNPRSTCDTFQVCLERKGADLSECRKRGITP